MHDINDKVFLITGAAAGIGARVVKTLLDKEAKFIAILDIDVAAGKSLEEELKAKHGDNRAKFYKCDVTTSELNETFNDVIKNYQYIDVVINNAGILNDSPKAYEKQVAINVTALMTSSLKAYNLMHKGHGGKGGTIINISSVVALFQGRLLPVYTATKSAVLQFSNCLGMEPHFSRTGVRVVTICFGCTRTSLFDKSKMDCFDEDCAETMHNGLDLMPWQNIESAVEGLVHAFQYGDSGSTWLVTSGRPAEDITANIVKAYETMSQGVFH